MEKKISNKELGRILKELERDGESVYHEVSNSGFSCNKIKFKNKEDLIDYLEDEDWEGMGN